MNAILNKVTVSVARSILKTKKSSPHIFFVAGIVGVATSTFLACKATLKLEETVDEIKEDLQTVKTLHESSKESWNKEYTEQAYYKDLGYLYGRSTIKITKLYGPSVVIGVVSITALTGSHIQLTRRNTALTVTLAAVSKAFDDYRVRVREELGEKRELEIHRAIRNEEIDVDGKKQLVKVTDSNGWSPYAKSFDSSNPNWKGNSEFNRLFIQCQQNYANHLLKARGHVFLNEVYDSLGLERTKPGAVVGWFDDGSGDGYVDFGMYEAYNNLTLIDQNFILDFNVDGVIYDKI